MALRDLYAEPPLHRRFVKGAFVIVTLVAGIGGASIEGEYLTSLFNDDDSSSHGVEKLLERYEQNMR